MDSENQSGGGAYAPTSQELTVTNQMRRYLLEAASWGKFIGVAGFILIGLMVIGAFTFGSVMSGLMGNLSGGGPNFMAGGAGLMVTVYFLLFAALYFFPTLYLYQFSTRVKSALLTNQELDLAFAFSRLKSFFKFWGILLIIILGFYALGIAAALIGVLVGSNWLGG